MKHLLYTLLLIPSLAWGETKVTPNEMFAASSSTILTNGNGYASASSASCYSGSTVTITTNGGRVLVSFSGTGSNATAGIQGITTGFLMDGAYTLGQSSTIGIQRGLTQAADYAVPISWQVVTGNLSVGSHTFCLRVFGDGATVGKLLSSVQQFWVQEIK